MFFLFFSCFSLDFGFLVCFFCSLWFCFVFVFLSFLSNPIKPYILCVAGLITLIPKPCHVQDHPSTPPADLFGVSPISLGSVRPGYGFFDCQLPATSCQARAHRGVIPRAFGRLEVEVKHLAQHGTAGHLQGSKGGTRDFLRLCCDWPVEMCQKRSKTYLEHLVTMDWFIEGEIYIQWWGFPVNFPLKFGHPMRLSFLSTCLPPWSHGRQGCLMVSWFSKCPGIQWCPQTKKNEYIGIYWGSWG